MRDKVDRFRVYMNKAQHTCEVCGEPSTWQCDRCFGWRCDKHQQDLVDELDRDLTVCANPECSGTVRA